MASEYLYLNSRDEFLRIDIEKIVYFEADGNYTNIIQINKLRGTVNMSLTQMQSALAERLKEKATTFVRIGKSYIVNIRYIYSINIVKQRLILSDGHTFAFQLSISREALKKLKQMMLAPKA